jgi:hypothetical protein
MQKVINDPSECAWRDNVNPHICHKNNGTYPLYCVSIRHFPITCPLPTGIPFRPIKTSRNRKYCKHHNMVSNACNCPLVHSLKCTGVTCGYYFQTRKNGYPDNM